MNQIKVDQRVSFLDYVFGGCEIKVNIAVDFTRSNGEVNEPNSLHFIGGANKQNQYTQAI